MLTIYRRLVCPHVYSVTPYITISSRPYYSHNDLNITPSYIYICTIETEGKKRGREGERERGEGERGERERGRGEGERERERKKRTHTHTLWYPVALSDLAFNLA